MKHLRLSILTLILAIALASLTSYNVSALDFSAADSRSYNRAMSYYYRIDASDNRILVNMYNYPDYVQLIGGALNMYIPSETKRLQSVIIGFTSNLPTKYLYNLSYRYCPVNPDDLKSWVGWSGDAYNSILNQQFAVNGTCVTGSLTGFGATERNYIYLSPGGGLVAGSTMSGASFIFQPITLTILSSDADYSSVLNAIKNNTNDIKTKMDDLKSSMDDLADNEGRVADVAEDEYNKTIEDEQTASSGAGGFSFNFSLPNPFGIFQVSDGCVSTPTIDSWLHLDGDWKSPHCPIIPANVRNILTPVVTLIVTLATLLVVIRWVSSSAVDVAGNSVAMNDKPQKGGNNG